MYNPRNNYDYNYNNSYGRGNSGRSNSFGSRYQYQTLPNGTQSVQAGGLIGKVMALLSFSFIFAALGGFVGQPCRFCAMGIGAYLIVVIAGFITLFALMALIQKPGINLFLLYLFTFLEGMGLGPLINEYMSVPNLAPLLAEAFLMTAIVSISLGLYAWTTKRDFSRIGDYLFVGVILLLVVGLLNIIFQSAFIDFLLSIFGIGIFSGYMLFYVQRAKYMADTMPNAIGLAVSLFLTMLNLFLYILELLTILQGGNRRH